MANNPLTSKQMAMETLEMLQEAFGAHPRWLVDLNDPPRVIRASLGAESSMEYKVQKGAYFVRARDELEAFMKARKIEEEGEEEC